MICLLNGDAQAIPLRAGSVDMIFTDPPYLKPYVHLYGSLAREAARVLKPGGFVVAMCGESYLNRIFRMFEDAGLTYYWLYTLGLAGRGFSCWRHNGVRAMPIGTAVKHVLAYSNGPACSRTATAGYYKAKGGADKAHHVWGQDEDSHRYWIDCFSAPGDLILDPMGGGGTTAVVCEALGRRCVTFDIDPVAIETVRLRLPLFAVQP